MSRKRVKHFLQLLLAVGILAVAMGGGGTFASFNAETANAGNSFATGTLYLHDSVNGATACTSESTTTNQNVPITVGGSNPGDQCGVLFSFPNTTTYNHPFTVHLALSDAGTIPGSDLKFQLNGSGCAYNDTGNTGTTLASLDGNKSANGGGLSSNLTTAHGAYTSIPVLALATRVPAMSIVHVTDGTNSQDFIASANASPGDTSISVESQAVSANITAPGTVSTITNVTTINLTGTTTVGIAVGAAIQIGTGTTGGNDTFSLGSVSAAPVGSSSLTVSTVSLGSLSSHPYSPSDGVFAAFGTNNACTLIPYSITETNSTYNGPSEGTTTGVINGTNGTTTGFEGCAFGSASGGGCSFSNSGPMISSIPNRNTPGFNTLTLSSGGGTGHTGGVNSGTGLDAQGGTRYFIITVYPQFGDPVMGETATFDLVWHMDQ